jgi:CBS domain-containing protein
VKVVTASVVVGATNQQALSEMDRLDTNTLAVVNRHEEYVGVITQDEIVRKVLARVLREV